MEQIETSSDPQRHPAPQVLGRSPLDTGFVALDRPVEASGAKPKIDTNASTLLPVDRDKVKEAWRELIEKLFVPRDDGRDRCLYRTELEECAATVHLNGNELLEAAMSELARAAQIRHDASGRISNAAAIGEHFGRVADLVATIADVYIISQHRELDRTPFSDEVQDKLRDIIQHGEAATVVILKTPPEEAALQIRAISGAHLNGLLSLWENPSIREKLPISDGLRDFLSYGTVRVLTTGHDQEANRSARSLNELFEQNGFENAHWLRLIKGMSQDEKKEALKDSLRVCLPIAVGVKALEQVAPHMLHVVGGVLDDLFGAIIPDVSQSLGNKALPFRERLSHAWPVLKGGLATLPVAIGCGWASTLLYHEAAPWYIKAAAGATFALACCAGTLGTSVAAFTRELRGIERAESNPITAEAVSSLGTVDRIKLAFQNSILDVPFRVGHTVIGVPLQFTLGVGAALTGAFHNAGFVMFEGMAETLLGAVAVFTYGHFARMRQRHELRNLASKSEG